MAATRDVQGVGGVGTSAGLGAAVATRPGDAGGPTNHGGTVPPTGESILDVRELSCGYDGATIIDRASFSMRAGSFACIIGANGCGKTTLLKTILGLLRPLGGGAYVRGRAVASMGDRERARALAYIPQAHRPPFPFKVADVVLMGRTPHVGRFSAVSHADKRAAWDALCMLGIEDLAQAVYTRLSGGQQQLVLIARALAQQPELIVMDEPTASLDFGNQHMVLSRMRELSREGASVLMVTHDPHHAIYCADTVVVVKGGRVNLVGTPGEIITGPVLRDIYGVPVDVVDAPLTAGGTRRVCVAL